jgi:hypothetical protein
MQVDFLNTEGKVEEMKLSVHPKPKCFLKGCIDSVIKQLEVCNKLKLTEATIKPNSGST